MSQERFEALYSNLQSIYKCKTAINNAITRKGESTTGMDFNDYTQAISNLNGKISTIPSNLVVDTVENITDRMDIDGIVLVTDNSNNLESIAYYNVTENTFNYTNKYGLSTNRQQAFSGTFLGKDLNVQEGALGTPFIASTEITDEFKMRIDSLDKLSYINLDPNVTDLSSAFSGKSNFIWIPNFNTSNITNMSQMFGNCYNLTTVPNFDTSNVVDMSLTFYYCRNLITVPNYNTTKVTNMQTIFYGCDNLTSVPNFNTSNVTIMMYAFANCFNLTTIPQFDTSNVRDIREMFENCNNLVSIPQFNTSNVIAMSQMFGGCNNLSSDSYANIVNMLPQANNLTNQYLNNIGLNVRNFTNDQINILNNKGYIDAVLPSPVQNYYEIQWE